MKVNCKILPNKRKKQRSEKWKVKPKKREKREPKPKKRGKKIQKWYKNTKKTIKGKQRVIHNLEAKPFTKSQ